MSRGAPRDPNERTREQSGPSGRGKGEGKPSPLGLVLEVLEVWRVCCLVSASTRLEAQGLGGFINYS